MSDMTGIQAARRLRDAASKYLSEANKALNQNEGWKGSGRCKICRRRAYCRKMCTAARERIRALERGTLAAMILTGLEGERNEKDAD